MTPERIKELRALAEKANTLAGQEPGFTAFENACDPQTILALLDALERAEKAAVYYHERYRGFMLGQDFKTDLHSCECTCNDDCWAEGEPERHKPDCDARPAALAWKETHRGS